MTHFLQQSSNIYFYSFHLQEKHILSKWANTTSYQLG